MSASVVVRRILATPARSAAEVWPVITNLLAPNDEAARQELERVGGVAMAIIALEAPRSSPIIVSGVGPLLRLYCLYDEEAIVGEDANEDPLSWSPTHGEWALSLPCPAEDLAWVTATLASQSGRVTARDQSQPSSEVSNASKQVSPALGPINVEAFRQR